MFSYERAKMNTQRLPRGSFDKAFRVMEKYSSGRRGAPAKGVGRVTVARVQIPPSAYEITPSPKRGSYFILEGGFEVKCQLPGAVGSTSAHTGGHICFLTRMAKQKMQTNPSFFVRVSAWLTSVHFPPLMMPVALERRSP